VGAGVANADTLTLDQYRARLADARALIDRSRTAATADRVRLLAQARELLRQTSAVRAGDETVVIDDGPVADLAMAPDGAARAIAILDTYIASAQRTSRIDPARADARLRELVSPSAPAQQNTDPLLAGIDYVLRALEGALLEIGGKAVDLGMPVIALLGAALVLFVIATLGRALPERIRSEVLVSAAGRQAHEDPAVHLRLADQALAHGHAREAIREVYLYALAALAAREAFRYDPALTDRELLARAAGIPHAHALVDLVTLYERAWFGLREPATAEAERARSLALRAAT